MVHNTPAAVYCITIAVTCRVTVKRSTHENWSWGIRSKLLLLEVVKDHSLGFRVNTPVLHNNTRAANNLPGLSLLVNLAESSPFTQFLVVVHFHQGDVVLIAERLDQLFVQGFTAVVRQDTQQSLTPGWIRGRVRSENEPSAQVCFIRLTCLGLWQPHGGHGKDHHGSGRSSKPPGWPCWCPWVHQQQPLGAHHLCLTRVSVSQTGKVNTT